MRKAWVGISLIFVAFPAFAAVEYPGDWCLRDSNEGDEPHLLEKEFAGKCDWRTLDPAFLDRAPGGYASALSFFSDEAFRFYLPAYIGKRGWFGIRLDRETIDWGDVESAIERSWRLTASRSLVARWDQGEKPD